MLLTVHLYDNIEKAGFLRSDRIEHVKELEDIQPALAEFLLRDERLQDAEWFRQSLLSEISLLTFRPQQRTQLLLSRTVNILLHLRPTG